MGIRKGSPLPSPSGCESHPCQIVFLDEEAEVASAPGLLDFAAGKIRVQAEGDGNTQTYDFRIAESRKRFPLHRAWWSMVFGGTCPVTRQDVRVTFQNGTFVLRIEPQWPHDDIDALEVTVDNANLRRRSLEKKDGVRPRYARQMWAASIGACEHAPSDRNPPRPFQYLPPPRE